VAKGPSPQWKKRMEPVLDHYVQASIDQVQGMPDEKGHYALLVKPGFTSYDSAAEIKRALYRSRNFVRHNGKPVSVWAEIVKAEDGSYQVHFKAIDRTMARGYIISKHGDDRSKWPYDPFAKREKERQ
jgi:hypothetical protein